MKICDRTYTMSGKAVKATHTVTIDSQVFHLCPDQHDLVLDFITNPPTPTFKDKVRKTLHLPARQTSEKTAA